MSECSEQIESEECCVCHLDVVDKDLEWAREQANHPGVLGVLHEKCYDNCCKEEPDLPWTDPISAEVNYTEMAEDLGVDCGETAEEEFWDETGEQG